MLSTSSRPHQATFFVFVLKKGRENMVKRLCLFAGYSSKSVIEDYVVYYIKELSKYADIYYCADCELSQIELQKITPYTKYTIAQRHKKYDFGSWGILFSKIDNLKKYDEILLVNDSCFGPLFSLDTIFAKMQDSQVSAWSICGNKFMMSFFIILKQDIFLSSWFKNFITSIGEEIDKNDIVRLYEIGLSDMITEKGLKWDCIFSSKNLKQQIKQHNKLINEGIKTIPLSIRIFHHFRPNKVRCYDDDFFILFLLGMPFIKKQAFGFNVNHFNLLAPLFINKYSKYDYDLIKKSLMLNNIKPLKISFWQKIRNHIKNFIFEKRYKEYGIVYRFCKIKIYVKKH